MTFNHSRISYCHTSTERSSHKSCYVYKSVNQNQEKYHNSKELFPDDTNNNFYKSAYNFTVNKLLDRIAKILTHQLYTLWLVKPGQNLVVKEYPHSSVPLFTPTAQTICNTQALKSWVNVSSMIKVNIFHSTTLSNITTIMNLKQTKLVIAVIRHKLTHKNPLCY